MEKVFLKPRSDIPTRGVELFNLLLVRDLVRAGWRVRLPAHASWIDELESVCEGFQPDVISIPNVKLDFFQAWLGARHASGEQADVLLVGNAGRSLIPSIRHLVRRRAFGRCVLIAHREATDAFVNLFVSMPAHILAVNPVIAGPFHRAGCRHVHVDYGVMNADRFQPNKDVAAPKQMVDFCLLGALDNAWKGADTAVEAFRGMDDRVRDRCRLHLASYLDPPDYPEPNIITYAWMDAQTIPGFLQEMDVMLAPSRDEGVMRETFSQAVVQGMLTGLPVLVSDRPVLTEKVEQGGGQVCELLDDMVEAMTRLANDEILRRNWGRQAREIALERYVWDTDNFIERYFRGPIPA